MQEESLQAWNQTLGFLSRTWEFAIVLAPLSCLFWSSDRICKVMLNTTRHTVLPMHEILIFCKAHKYIFMSEHLNVQGGWSTPKQEGLPHMLCLNVAKQGQVGSCQLDAGNFMGRFLELGGGENIDLALCVCNQLSVKQTCQNGKQCPFCSSNYYCEAIFKVGLWALNRWDWLCCPCVKSSFCADLMKKIVSCNMFCLVSCSYTAVLGCFLGA